MTRTSRDIIDESGVVKHGYDYNLQVWVRDYLIRDCAHPTHIKNTKLWCCNQHRYCGQDVRKVEGHEERAQRQEG